MRRIGIVGIIILFAGILIVVYFSLFVQHGIQRKELSVIQRMIDELNVSCFGCPLPTGEELVINVPTVIYLEESATVEVLYQQSGLSEREITIQTSGTNFDITPNDSISRKVGAIPERWVWVISPKKLGKQSLVLQFSGVSGALLTDNQQGHTTLLFDDSMKQQVSNDEYLFTTNAPVVYTIEVVDIFGFSVKEGAFLGYLVSFLGSALTFPWLYSIWEKRREQKFETEMKAIQKEHQQKIDELEKQIKDKEVKRKKKTRF
jgi:hypothetical protein